MNYESAQRYNISPMPERCPVALASSPNRDCCIKANRCVAFGIRLRSHTEVCSLQTSPSAPCASSFLQSLDNLACKIVRLLTFATVSLSSRWSPPSDHDTTAFNQRNLYRHGGNLKFFCVYFLFSSGGRKNSSEVSFDSSEEISIASVENFYFPRSYLEFLPEESKCIGAIWTHK